MALGCSSRDLIRIFPLLISSRRTVFSKATASATKERHALLRSYQILEMTEKHSTVEIKDAFLKLAKRYHPDSNDTPDQEKFRSIETAYRAVMEARKTANPSEEVEEVTESDLGFNRMAPQHRQYLSNEGYGYGTPTQRQRQYQSFRLDRANDSAFNYRMEKKVKYTEEAMVALDRQATKKNKTQNAIERVVEDLIQESMAKGEFQQLSGMGKPLNYSDHNPYVDSMTHKLNRILINNGFVPEWAMLGKEIETLKSELRTRLIQERANYGEYPTERDQHRWRAFLAQQKDIISEMNTKIHRFNFMCPTLQQQLCEVRIDLFAEKVYNGDSWKGLENAERKSPNLGRNEARQSGELQKNSSASWSLWDLLKS